MLKVLKAGFYTTVQDKGRHGYTAFGVPVSGVMDNYSADLANQILNNSIQDAVIEITLGACAFQFLQKTSICISGADFSPTINDVPVHLNKRITIEENDILSFGKVSYGVRCYLAVKGGFLTPKVLGSRSFYANITENHLLKKDDLIVYSLVNKNFKTSKAIIKVEENHFNSKELKCFKGPEYNLLTQHQKQQLNTLVFSISNANNRMGYQLNEIIQNDLPQILTSSVLPGTVQLTPSGKLIVLMKDCQVTGGYPRILQLTENAIHKLAQKKVNETILFTW